MVQASPPSKCVIGRMELTGWQESRISPPNSDSGNYRRSFKGITGFPKARSSTYYSAMSGRAHRTGGRVIWISA
jgi:hypothetical protein